MATHARGLICLALDEQQVARLGLPMMAVNNRSKYQTNFTVSIEAAKGVTTGISAFDRAITVQAAANQQAKPEDIVTPGHIFPLKSLDGGVLRRAGQTEGSVDLARLAGLAPSAVICEIMAEDGHMARYDDLQKFSKQQGIRILTIKSLINHRLKTDIFVHKIEEASLPTKIGHFKVIGFKNKLNGENYIALIQGEIAGDEPLLVRVHSQCLTGDVFGSLRCDCQEQLHQAMAMIDKAKRGVVLYLPQEGRGIGILNKIRAYKLQDDGKDTVDANHSLGFAADLRDYGFGAQVLVQLGVKKIKLITNNPKKIVALNGYGIDVVDRMPIEIIPNEHNQKYLHAKRDRLGHMIGHN